MDHRGSSTEVPHSKPSTFPGTILHISDILLLLVIGWNIWGIMECSNQDNEQRLVLWVTPCLLKRIREFIHTQYRNTRLDLRPRVVSMGQIYIINDHVNENRDTEKKAICRLSLNGSDTMVPYVETSQEIQMARLEWGPGPNRPWARGVHHAPPPHPYKTMFFWTLRVSTIRNKMLTVKILGLTTDLQLFSKGTLKTRIPNYHAGKILLWQLWPCNSAAYVLNDLYLVSNERWGF